VFFYVPLYRKQAYVSSKFSKRCYNIKILALDQARNGAWSIFDATNKALLAHGTWSFPVKKFDFSRAVYEITRIATDLVQSNNIDVVFIEDTQLRQNAQSFKKLAQLQGALINLFEGLGVQYESVPPTRWQSYCGARGRSFKEQKSNAMDIPSPGPKASKLLSMQFVYTQFGIETDNDNLADAIAIGWYAVNHIKNEKELPCKT